MDCQQFQSQLRETGGYETAPSGEVCRSDRLLGRFDAWFYLRTFGIVLAAGSRAQRGRYTSDELARSSFATLRLVEGCRGLVRISGAKNLARVDGAVVMANHMSMLETFLLPVILLTFGKIITVVKQSLLNYPFFGSVLRSQPVVAVTRKDPRGDLARVLEGGARAHREGRKLVLFPQATRSPVLRPSELNTLAVKAAARAKVPLIPLALKTDFQRIGRVVRDVGRLDRSRAIHFAFGEPMIVDGNGKDAQARAIRFITENVRQWGGTVDD